MIRLSPEQFRSFLSPYLIGGWQQEEIVLSAVDVEPGLVRGIITPKQIFPASDGTLHLAVPAAFIWIAQLGIIYACWDQKLPKKPGEVLLRELHLKCRRVVDATREIDLTIAVTAKRVVAEGVFYSGDISVDRDAFVGEARFVLPIPRTEAEPAPSDFIA